MVPGGIFVGRTRELSVLEAGVEHALAGRGTIFLVGGEAGIGKSRLALALADTARRRGLDTVWGRCLEDGGAPAYWPWVQIVRGCLAGASLAAPGADVARLLSAIGEPADGAPPGLDPERARFRLFDGVATVLREAAARTPLLVVLDDLHRADVPSLRLLDFVVGDLAGLRACIVACYRDGPLHGGAPLRAALGMLSGAPVARHVALAGLDETAVAQYLTASGVAPDLAGALVRRTGGNAFFVAEVTRLLVAEPAMRTASAADIEAFALPVELRDVVMRRLAPLPAECRAVLAVAAVVGRTFTLPVLERVTGLRRPLLLAHLDGAIAAGLVTAVPGSPASHHFAHVLIRDVLYDEQPRAERLALHCAIAAALEALHGDGAADQHLAEIARHACAAAEAGERVAEAAAHAVRAAERASEQLAFEEAAVQYERALHALECAPPVDPERRCELLVAMGEAHRHAGDAARARATLAAAGDLARRVGRRDLLARAALGFAGWGQLTVLDGEIVERLELALEELDPTDVALRVPLLARLATELSWSPETQARSRVLGEETVVLARGAGDPRLLARALLARHATLLGPDHATLRADVADEVVRVAVWTRDRATELSARVWRVQDLIELGRMAAADREIEACAALADELREPLCRWWVGVWRAMRSALAGRFAVAEEHARQAFAIGGRATPAGRRTLDGQLVEIRRAQGRLAEIEATADILTAPSFHALLRCGLARFCADMGRHDDAARLLREIADDPATHLPRDAALLTCLALLAETCAAVGDAGSAATLYGLLAPWAERTITTPGAAICYGAATRHLGLLAATAGRVEQAAEHFAHAVEENDRIGARTWAAHARLEHAQSLARRGGAGDRQRARALATAAHAAARELGMAPLEAAAGTFLDAFRDEQPATSTGEANAFRLEGEFWTIRYAGTACHLRNTKGLAYIARLLRHPGQDVHAVELVTGLAAHGQSPIPALDGRARAEYRDRLVALACERAEAEQHNDAGRLAALAREHDVILRELEGTTGLGGRDRHLGSDDERARLLATKCIKAALRRIGAAHPALGRHLEASVRTGYFCAYVPPADPAPGWSDPA